MSEPVPAAPRADAGGGAAAPIDKKLWLRLSPLLDDLLDLEPAQRGEHLARLRADDAGLADELERLMATLPELDASGFMQGTPPLPGTGHPGQMIGPWQLDHEIGQGGMGSVWRAHRTDGRFEGHAAVKFLNLGLMTRSGLDRFAREGRILARLSHPNIARLIDAGLVDERQPYLLLEYIDGQPIDRYCDAHDLDVPARLKLFLDVLAAVAHAHTRLILHRDIKPGNILVTAAGEVKLLDFGVATLLAPVDSGGSTAAEPTIGAPQAFTPAYAAPEQVLGGEMGTPTDVYALGVLLFQLLGGGHPTNPLRRADHPDASHIGTMRAVVEGQSRRLSDAAIERAQAAAREPGAQRSDLQVALKRARGLRGDIDTIVGKALRKAPGERYANASEFAADLRRHLAHEPILARNEAPLALVRKFVRRHRAGVAMAVGFVLTLSGATALALWQAHERQQQRLRAESLVEFMLGDLRKRLEPVGRLEVLDGVGSEVLRYYDKAPSHGLDDAQSLAQRARAQHLIGEIRERRGQYAESLAVFKDAALSTQRLMEAAPKDTQRIFNHSQSVYWVGHAARALALKAESRAAFEQYLALTRRLTELEPDHDDWIAEEAFAEVAVGVDELEASQAVQALASFERAATRFAPLAARRPELMDQMATFEGWIASAYQAMNNYPQALAAQQRKLAALDRLPDMQSNRPAESNRAIALQTISTLQLALGDTAAATASAGQAVDRLKALVTLDPANMSWKAWLVNCELTLTGALLEDGHRDEAQAHWQAAAALLREASGSQVAHSVRGELAGNRLLALQARLDPGAGDLRAALQARAQGWAPIPAHADNLADQRFSRTNLLLNLGDLQAAHRDTAAAEATWSQALSLMADLGTVPFEDIDKILLGRLHARLGHKEVASALLEAVRHTSFKHPDVNRLAQELSQPPLNDSKPPRR